MARSQCEVGAHQPVRDFEYRVIHYLEAAYEPRWIATYHSTLDIALDDIEKMRARGDQTARLQECVWRDAT